MIILAILNSISFRIEFYKNNKDKPNLLLNVCAYEK